MDKKRTKTKEPIIALLDEILVILGAIIIILLILYQQDIISLTTLASITAVIAVAIAFIAHRIIITYNKPSIIGTEALLGQKAIVIEDLNPEGKILIEGEIWKARTIDNTRIPAGQKVVVKNVEGLTLLVEKSGEK